MKTTYTHKFENLSGEFYTTRIDLSKVESVAYGNDATKAELILSNRASPLTIYCSPESLKKFVHAWEQVRGAIVTLR